MLNFDRISLTFPNHSIFRIYNCQYTRNRNFFIQQFGCIFPKHTHITNFRTIMIMNDVSSIQLLLLFDWCADIPLGFTFIESHSTNFFVHIYANLRRNSFSRFRRIDQYRRIEIGKKIVSKYHLNVIQLNADGGGGWCGILLFFLFEKWLK